MKYYTCTNTIKRDYHGYLPIYTSYNVRTKVRDNAEALCGK